MSTQKAEDLIAVTERIAVFTEREIAILKGDRPAALGASETERATLLVLYGKAAAEWKAASAIKELPRSVQLRLKGATERLHKALKEHGRLVARFRHVSEGLIKAIADGVAARQAPASYARPGSLPRPSARSHASALTLNQTV
jgi:hypothetical protein